MSHVLFVCIYNAARSQMSRVLFERAAAGRHTAASAGTEPAARVHPEVVEVMGCGDRCPYVAGVRDIDWELPDPKGQAIDAVRRTRDRIARRVDQLVAELDALAAD